MLIGTLLRHRWKRLLRADTAGMRVVKGMLALVVGAYFVLSAVGLGLLFPLVAENAAPGTPPALLLNRFLPLGLLGLLGMRFFFQPSSQTDLRPYVPRPVSRPWLVCLTQLLSLPSLLNGLALCFLVPVWLTTIRPATDAAGVWLAGVLLLVLVTHFLVLPLRIASGRRGQRFWTAVALVTALVALDEAVGYGGAGRVSGAFLGTLMQGNPISLLALGGVLAAVYVGNGQAVLHALRTDFGQSQRRGGRFGGWLTGLTRTGSVGALAAVELNLILRNNRARMQAILAVLFSVGYTLLSTGDAHTASPFVAAFVGVLSSAAFGLFYGQFLFSWDSAHLDGLLARVPTAQAFMRAKLRLLQGSCLALYLLGLPFFVWLRPGFLPTHAAFLLFNAGVICPLVMSLGIYTTKAIDLSKGSFMNYEGTSWVQFAQMALVIAPVVGLLLLPAHLWVIGGLGLAGLLASPVLTAALARLFNARRYRMLAGFRSSSS